MRMIAALLVALLATDVAAFGVVPPPAHHHHHHHHVRPRAGAARANADAAGDGDSRSFTEMGSVNAVR